MPNSDEAFCALAEGAQSLLAGLAWRFGTPHHEMEDVMQEVLMRAWRAWPRFRGDSAPETWLTRIAVNHLVSRRRKLARYVKTFVPWNEAVAQRTGTRWKPEQSEHYEIAVAAVDRLPAKLRAAFVLRYLQGMSCAEVAEVLELKEPAVRRRCYLARNQLREMLRGKLA